MNASAPSDRSFATVNWVRASCQHTPRAKGLASLGIPRQAAFALIVDANDIDRFDGLETRTDVADEFLRVVLEEAGLRMMLFMPKGEDDLARAIGVRKENAGALSSLIDGRVPSNQSL